MLVDPEDPFSFTLTHKWIAAHHELPLTQSEMEILTRGLKLVKDIHESEQHLEHAKRCLAEVEKQFAWARRARSPISRLPVEVLGRIFDFAKDDLPQRYPNQFVIARVCRKWRDIVLGNPALWSSYRITDDDELEEADWNIRRYAANAQLGIELVNVWCHDASLLSFDEVAIFLMKWGARVGRLDLTACPHALETLVTSVLPEEGRMYDVSLRLAECGSNCKRKLGPTQNKEWPTLHRLFIDLEGSPVVRINAPVLRQLTVNIRQSSVADIFAFLREFSYVSDLELSFSDDVFCSFARTPLEAPIHFNNLRSLRLQDLPRRIWEMTRMFRMPLLKRITVIADERNTYKTTGDFHIWFLVLLQCHGTVRELNLDIDNVDLKPLFLRMANIHHRLMLPKLTRLGVHSRRSGRRAVASGPAWEGPGVDEVFDPVLSDAIVNCAAARVNTIITRRIRQMSLVPPPNKRDRTRLASLGVECDDEPAAKRRRYD